MRRAAVVLVVLGLAGCADADTPGGPDAGMPGEPVAAPSPGFELEERGTEPAGPMVEPSLVLVRDPRQAESAAANAPADGAAELIRSWDRFDERALLVVYGGTVPDGGTSVRIDGVSLDEDGRYLTVAGALVADDPAIQVVSIAWAAISLDADLVARAETCALALEEREQPDNACSPAIPYASK